MAEPITTGIMVIGTALNVAGTLMTGRSADDSAKAEAAQMRQQAGQERATSQRVAIERRREAELASSRARALAGASGASSDDVTMQNITSRISQQGEYNALTAMFEGEERARGLEYGADVRRAQGKTARRASFLGAASDAAAGMYGIYSGYTAQQKYSPQSSLPWRKGMGAYSG